jgi:hypothetical protein
VARIGRFDGHEQKPQDVELALKPFPSWGFCFSGQDNVLGTHPSDAGEPRRFTPEGCLRSGSPGVRGPTHCWNWLSRLQPREERSDGEGQGNPVPYQAT